MDIMETRYQEQQPRRGWGRGSEEVRVRDVWNSFQTWMRDDQGYSEQTRRGYMGRCQAAHRWLRTNGYQGLPWATEESLRGHWDSVAPSAPNRAHVRSALVSFFRFVNDAGWRPDNPATALPRPKQPRRLPRPIPQGDAKKLLDVAEAMGPMVAAMVNVFAYCGLRNAELRALQWADIDGPWLRVTQGKGGKDRDVPIPPPALLALIRWRNASQSSGWVFHASRNPDRPMSQGTLNYLMHELADTACVEKVTPHVLRHTYATQMLAISGDLRAVQEAMGHSRPETTALYTKVSPTKLAEIVKDMTY